MISPSAAPETSWPDSCIHQKDGFDYHRARLFPTNPDSHVVTGLTGISCDSYLPQNLAADILVCRSHVNLAALRRCVPTYGTTGNGIGTGTPAPGITGTGTGTGTGMTCGAGGGTFPAAGAGGGGAGGAFSTS